MYAQLKIELYIEFETDFTELGGRVPWIREATKLDQGFVRFQTWREGILVLVFKINKDVMSFFFPNHCSMCD